MRWRKLGLIFNAEEHLPSHPKLHSHAANPLPVHIEGDVYRVFFSARDAQKRASVGAVDIDIARRRISRLYTEPVFVHGKEGSFYADGISVGNVYAVGKRHFMLFMAWQVAGLPHWRGEIGRLELRDDLSLALAEPRPFLPLNETDPVSLSYPFVAKTQQGYAMWYGSTVSWDAGNGEMLHVLRAASSFDGENWLRTGETLPCTLGSAQAFSRPTLVSDEEGDHMWFSYRGAPSRTYRIGYAHRPVGGSWDMRNEDAGIDVSTRGWDSEMIEYPFVFDHDGCRYMLYNGNGYGRTGFGLAVLES